MHNDKDLKNIYTVYNLTALRADLMLGLRNINILIRSRAPVFANSLHRFQLSVVFRGPKIRKLKKKRFISFKTPSKREWIVTW
jgi:hypothetical protein